jgi:hypothetical protein
MTVCEDPRLPSPGAARWGPVVDGRARAVVRERVPVRPSLRGACASDGSTRTRRLTAQRVSTTSRAQRLDPRGVTSMFVQSATRNIRAGAAAPGAARDGLSEDLWETDLWPDEAPTAPTPSGGLHGSAPVPRVPRADGPRLRPQRRARAVGATTTLRRAHVVVPQPRVHQSGGPGLPRPLPRQGEADARRAHEDDPARPVPRTHRHHGTPYGVLVGSLPSHLVEHAAQIRQFLTAAGIRCDPCRRPRHVT